MNADRIVIECPKSSHKLRIPVLENAIVVTCTCGHQFVHPGTKSDAGSNSSDAFVQQGTSHPLMNAAKSGFKNYFNFKGRTSRSEWWYWILIVNGVLFALVFAQILLSAPSGGGLVRFTEGFYLFCLMPGLSMHVRRLHDINRSGWWLLIIPTILGIGQILIWSFVAGDPESNKYGPPPFTKSKSPAPTVKHVWLKYAVAVASALAGQKVGSQNICEKLADARWADFRSMLVSTNQCQDGAGLYLIGSLLTSFFVCRYINDRLGKPVLGSLVGLTVGVGTGAVTAFIYFNNLYRH